MSFFSTSRTLLVCFSFASLCFYAGSEEATVIRHAQRGAWNQVERSNWSRYDNGKYTGLTHRESRSFLDAIPTSGGGTSYTGHCYVLEETLRDMQRSARGVDEVEEVSFTVNDDGSAEHPAGSAFPTLRGFPAFPRDPVRPGDSWQAEGIRVVDPMRDGARSYLPIVVEYRLVGPEEYRGVGVWRIKAKYATRVPKYGRPKGIDTSLKDAAGTHDVDIIVSRESGAAMLILDRLDETFTYATGSTVRFRGSTAYFGEMPSFAGGEDVLRRILSVGEDAASDARKPMPPSGEDAYAGTGPGAGVLPNGRIAKEPSLTNVPETGVTAVPLDEDAPFTVETTSQGIRLSVRDIRFVPDSDEILPEESWRLDAIRDALSSIAGTPFLVEGHTASIGRPEGEKSLSILRAKRVISELTKRGIPEERFMYLGWGGERPIGDNATREGRALNRRVEITILE
jgi:outer membrane protein OmpA-like peptidoglycan-associated protein